MRRPNVYQRSAPRARRAVERQVGADQGPAARAVLDALPALLRDAEAAGAVTLARYLEQAMSEAEGIARRDVAVVEGAGDLPIANDGGASVRLREAEP